MARPRGYSCRKRTSLGALLLGAAGGAYAVFADRDRPYDAVHIKNVPGRKTDVKDSEWIADLLRHGLIHKSYVPPKDLRELRDLLRYRVKLVQSRTSECNRLQRLLETASIKLASVMTDVFGVSGRAMLDAIVKEGYVPADVAKLARGVLRRRRATSPSRSTDESTSTTASCSACSYAESISSTPTSRRWTNVSMRSWRHTASSSSACRRSRGSTA